MKALRLAPLAVVVAVVAATVGIGDLGQPSPKPAASRTKPVVVPVDGATLVCPAAPAQDPQTSTRTVVGTGSAGGGIVTVEPIDRSTATLGPLALTAAAPFARVGTLTEKSLVVRATGPAAAGLMALRTTLSSDPKLRGLEADRCVTPSTQWWFAGVSEAAQVTSVLHLANADDSPAGVNVTGLTDKGPISSVLTTGLLLDPHTRLDVPLDQLTRGVVPALAVQVLATHGRVAASITETRSPTPEPQGLDSVPSQSNPSPSIVVPGVPGSPGIPGQPGATTLAPSTNTQTLYVAVPGPQNATVHVEISDGSGRFLAVNADTFAVASGTEQAVVLTPALTKGAVTLRVYSDDYVPIVAGVAVTTAPKVGEYRESLHVGPATSFSARAVIGDLRYVHMSGAMVDTEITLTSYAKHGGSYLDGGATLQVVPGGTPLHVVIPATKSVIVKASFFMPPNADPRTATITPDPGTTAVYGGVLLEELAFNGPLLGGYSISGGAGTVTLPGVEADPTLPLVDARGTG